EAQRQRTDQRDDEDLQIQHKAVQQLAEHDRTFGGEHTLLSPLSGEWAAGATGGPICFRRSAVYWISASVRPYFSASSATVPSSFSLAMDSLTMAVKSLPLRKAMP